MNIHSIYRVVLPFFRRRRMQRFLAAVPLTHQTQMLDVGGYPSFWQNWALPAKITILNLAFAPGLPEQFAGKYKLVVGDGTQLNFKDKEFDLVFSNSVIEHLGSYVLQEKFAHEARRVGGGVWIQTPARAFFFEPHLLTPFIHWFPRGVRRRLLRYGTVWGWMTRPSKTQVEDFLNEVRLLNYAEMKALFPDCTIYRERFLGLTKSYIAFRKTAPPKVEVNYVFR